MKISKIMLQDEYNAYMEDAVDKAKFAREMRKFADAVIARMKSQKDPVILDYGEAVVVIMAFGSDMVGELQRGEEFYSRFIVTLMIRMVSVGAAHRICEPLKCSITED